MLQTVALVHINVRRRRLTCIAPASGFSFFVRRTIPPGVCASLREASVPRTDALFSGGLPVSDDADWPDEGAGDTALVLIRASSPPPPDRSGFRPSARPLAALVRRDARAWLGALGFPHATPIALRIGARSAEAAESTGIDDPAFRGGRTTTRRAHRGRHRDSRRRCGDDRPHPCRGRTQPAIGEAALNATRSGARRFRPRQRRRRRGGCRPATRPCCCSPGAPRTIILRAEIPVVRARPLAGRAHRLKPASVLRRLQPASAAVVAGV